MYLARHAKQVYGIEIVAPAIENAKKNAEENKCSNAEFICGDAAVELPKLLKVKIGHPHNSHEVIEYPKMLYFKPFLYLLLYLSHQYY